MTTLIIRQLILSVLVATLATSCSTISPDTPYELADLSPEAVEERALIARMQSVHLPFEGFAPLEPDADWRIGDELLFGVEYRGAKEVIQWTLGVRIESHAFTEGSLVFVEDGPAIPIEEARERSIFTDSREAMAEYRDGKRKEPPLQFFSAQDFKFSFNTTDGMEWSFDSESILASARIYDEDGQEIERQVSVVPETFLRWGFQEACALSVASAASGEPIDLSNLTSAQVLERTRPFAGAVASIFALFQVMRENRALEPILWKVIERPSVFSLIANFGADLSISPDFERSELDVRPLLGRTSQTPAYRFPIQFVVNDKLALRTTLSVVEPAAPLRAAAGLIAIDGVHPRHPERRVAIRLLASRRGPDPTIPSAD